MINTHIILHAIMIVPTLSFAARRLLLQATSRAQRGCLAFGTTVSRVQNGRDITSAIFQSSWSDNDVGDDWASSSLPYSTTASVPAPESKTKSASAKSSLPFQAPRSSFDDSMPVTLTADGSTLDGALEWSKLGLLEDLVNGVTLDVSAGGLGLIEGPTPVQKMAIPEILSGCKDRMASIENIKNKGAKSSSSSSSSFDVDVSSPDTSSTKQQFASIPPVRSVAFAAATGSGKTLSYLLPVIQSLRAQEMMALTASSTSNSTSVNKALSMEALSQLRRPRRPRAVVLAPTRELARQILSVLKSVGHTCKISSELLVGGDDYGTQRKRLNNRPVDILVATPGRLVKHRDAGD